MISKDNMLPSITISIPTYNEEENIGHCLDSIFSQDYPKNLLEVFVVDNYSKDRTIAIAKQYPVSIIRNGIKNTHISNMKSFKRASGDLFFYMDADLQLRTNQYFKRMVHPLLDDPEIVGSFTKMYQIPNDNSLNRFLTYHPLQQDPVYQFFSPTIESTIVAKRKGYYLCEYKLGRIPAVGRCLYWRKKLLKTPIADGEKYMDLDNVVILTENGFNKFAYVPSAGEYHKHVADLKGLIKKRLRNIRRNYLPHYETRKYLWFNLQNKKDILKIFFWIAYANLIFPAFIKGIFKAIKYKDIWCILYEPFLSFILTDIILYGFLSSSRGWTLVRKSLLS